MNNDRRKRLQDLQEKGNALNDRLKDLMSEYESLQAEIEEVKDEEQNYYDNMPESLQGGDKGSAAEQVVSDLDTVLEAIGDFVGTDKPDFDDLTANI